MKLFEDLEDMGGTIRDAVKKIIADVYKQEIKDDALDEIVNNLSLSDLLELDRAYTAQDMEKIKGVLGPMPQMEYSMGGGRQATSQASNRPLPRTAQGQQPQKEPGTQNTVQTNRSYSSGAQNAVTSKKVDINNPVNPNDPNAKLDPNTGEPLEESGSDAERLARHREDLKDAKREYHAATSKAEKEHLKQYILKVQRRIDNIVNNPVEEDAPSPVQTSGAPTQKQAPTQKPAPTKSAAPAQGQPPAQALPPKTARPESRSEEPAVATAEQPEGHPEGHPEAADTASVSDVSFYSDEQPQVATPEEDGRPAEEIKVVDMVKWLKRRAGLS
ncbi:MAG: hypothetical protein HC788_05575 [Sphingopyxis sp.]|nr:hypothetical protein [Sphingopyxis sp.]